MKSRLALVCVLLLAVVAGCFETPKEPVAPTTDVQLSMPIADRTFFIGDFAEDEPMLTPTGDGGYLFRTGDEIRPIGINPISIQLDTASEFVSLGSFVVDDPAPSFTRVTYREITGFDPPPVPAPVPEATYTVPGTDVGPTGTFETVTFESGTATLRIRNTLPFPVDFPAGVRLRNNRTSNPVDTSTVVQFSFGTRVILPGGVDSSVVDMAGVTMQTLSKIMDAPLHTSGSGGVPVTIGSQDGLELRLVVTGVRVSSALAMIPNQTIISYDNESVTLDEFWLGYRSPRGGWGGGTYRPSFEKQLHDAGLFAGWYGDSAHWGRAYLGFEDALNNFWEGRTEYIEDKERRRYETNPRELELAGLWRERERWGAHSHPPH